MPITHKKTNYYIISCYNYYYYQQCIHVIYLQLNTQFKAI